MVPKAAPNAAPSEGGVEAVKRRLNRLALDVHDGPMQNLAVIGFSLGDLRRKMHALVPADHHAGIDAGMEQIGAELGRVEDELRALIGALEHGAVTSVPVVDAIRWRSRSSAVARQSSRS
jgi:signal transduction histidine kinase